MYIFKACNDICRRWQCFAHFLSDGHSLACAPGCQNCFDDQEEKCQFYWHFSNSSAGTNML